MKATTEIASDKENNNVQKQKHKRQGFLLCIYYLESVHWPYTTHIAIWVQENIGSHHFKLNFKIV